MLAATAQHPAAGADALSALLTLVADRVRARVLSALLATDDELRVGDLAIALDVTEDAVRCARGILRAAGLVHRRREGHLGYCRLRDGERRTALLAAVEQRRSLAQLHPERLPDEDEDT